MPFVEEASLSDRIGGQGYYSKCWAYANITLSTSGDKVNWKIVMETPKIGSDAIPLIRLEFFIDDQTIYNEYFTNYGRDFPCLNGSSAEGSITLENPTNGSIPVIFNMGLNFSQSSKTQYRTSYTLTRTYYTDGSPPAVSILNPGDNTYRISMTAGDPGDSNTRTKSIIYYTTDGSDPATSSTSRSMIELDGTEASYITNSTTITEDRTIKAIAYSSFKYGSETSSEVKSANILFYAAPKITTPPYISYTKNRFTLKEPWKIIFNAEAGNSRAPIASYIVSVFVNDMSKLIIPKAESTSINIDGISWEADTQTLTIDPIAKEFKVGDKVKIYLEVRAKTGASNIVTSTKAESIEYVVQNAGIVRVKVNDEWKEGQVYIKAGDTWHEAETVYVKTSSGWKESQ